MTIEVIGDRVDLLGECPVWDDRIDRLYTIDIDGRIVCRLDPSTGRDDVRPLVGRPGAIALTDDPDRLLVASEHELLWLEWSSGSTVPWRELETGGPRHRLNDGAPDRDGRFWVGSMHEDATESTGLLHRVEANGESTIEAANTGVPNGLAFSPDGTTMYYADSLARAAWAYDYERSTGHRSAERQIADFADLPGTADGATVDADGCYWIACVFGSALARITPSGLLDRIIELPVDKPTKPAFGGVGLGTLFVTSIGGGGSHPRSDDPGLNGRLLALDVGVSGVPEPRIATVT